MIELEIWEEACERVGISKCRWDCDDHLHCGSYYPPIGDPACVVAMFEHLALYHSRTCYGCDETGYWVNNSRMKGGAIHGYESIPLALAAAVNTTPVAKDKE